VVALSKASAAGPGHPGVATTFTRGHEPLPEVNRATIVSHDPAGARGRIPDPGEPGLVVERGGAAFGSRQMLQPSGKVTEEMQEVAGS
jgi:hypothetical protein